jgi:hypothetical protein
MIGGEDQFHDISDFIGIEAESVWHAAFGLTRLIVLGHMFQIMELMVN